MRRIIILLLSFVILLNSCGPVQKQTNSVSLVSSTVKVEEIKSNLAMEKDEPVYKSLDDEKLLRHIEDLVYRDTITSLNSDEYVVENVSAVYISKEYLDEVAFNSQSNIYFGYSLAELDNVFQGKKYIFTLSDNGTTTVKELEEIKDQSTETMIKNVAIGTGVILICVTVSVLTQGTGATAISAVFASSAKSATSFALSSAVFGGVSAGVVRGIQTGDFNEAIKASSMEASEEFKWGAIGGAIIGGGKKAFSLKQGTKGGLSLNEVAIIQKESKYPIEIISSFKNKDQYQKAKNIGLIPTTVNGKHALGRIIDSNYVDENGLTNIQRMLNGKPALDPTGKPYELHHLGQKIDSPLAILTHEEHMGKENNKIWHVSNSGSENPSSQKEWAAIRKEFWKDFAKKLVNGEF
jgi:hypothetical protein